MQTLPGAVVSRSWLKKLPLVLQLSNGSGICSPATLHLIYKALIQPHFDYCNVVWGSCGIKLADKLQKLQNRAARALTFSRYDANASQLFQNLNCKNLSTQRDIQKALMVFRARGAVFKVRGPNHLFLSVVGVGWRVAGGKRVVGL